jgi:undecaprenyl-diphosphatase
MSFLHALLLGLLEGVTEFLPISSTAHLLLAEKLLHMPQTEFAKSFAIVIQLGAILAVVALYAKRLVGSMTICLKILAAFVPTAIMGFVLHDLIKDVFFESTSIILWAMLIGGLVLILFEQWHSSTSSESRAAALDRITYHQAILIGLAQSIAVIPGVSRAGATILGGLVLGLSRKAIVEFSFLLAIPTMLGAVVLDLGTTGSEFSGQEWTLLAVGFVAAFLSALLSVRWLLKFIQHHSFTTFGMYRIIAALVLWMVLY